MRCSQCLIEFVVPGDRVLGVFASCEGGNNPRAWYGIVDAVEDTIYHSCKNGVPDETQPTSPEGESTTHCE